MTRASFSFRTRLTLHWTAAFGLLLAVTMTTIYVASRVLLYRDLDRQVRTLAATEMASAVDESRGVHLHDFPLDALGTSEFAGKFAQLYAADGRLLAQSPGLERLRFHLGRDVLQGALRGDAPIATVTVGERPGRVVALRATKDGASYVIAVGLYSDRLAAHLDRLTWLLAACGSSPWCSPACSATSSRRLRCAPSTASRSVPRPSRGATTRPGSIRPPPTTKSGG